MMLEHSRPALLDELTAPRNALKPDFLELIDLVKAGKIPLKKIITDVYKFDQAPRAFQEMSENAGRMLKVIIDFT